MDYFENRRCYCTAHCKFVHKSHCTFVFHCVVDISIQCVYLVSPVIRSYCINAQLRRILRRSSAALGLRHLSPPTRSYPAAMPVHSPGCYLITYLHRTALAADVNGLGLVAEWFAVGWLDVREIMANLVYITSRDPRCCSQPSRTSAQHSGSYIRAVYQLTLNSLFRQCIAGTFLCMHTFDHARI